MKQLLSNSLMYTKTPMIDTSVIQFLPDKAIVNYKIAADVVVLAQYNKTFFITLEVDEEGEYFASTVTQIKDRLGFGFSNAEKITMTLSDDKVIFDGGTKGDVSNETKQTPKRDLITPFKSEITEIGIIPLMPKVHGNPEAGYNSFPFQLQAQIPISIFSDIPASDEIDLYYNKETQQLHFELSDILGSRKRTIPIKQIFGEPQDLHIKFHYRTFEQILKQFNGDVWFSMSENLAVISTTTKDYSLTCILGARKEVQE